MCVSTTAPLVAAMVAVAWRDGEVARHLLGPSKGPASAANAVFVLFTLSGQLAVFLNLTLVLAHSFWGATAEKQDQWSRQVLKTASMVLFVLWIALLIYFGLAGLTMYCGLRIRNVLFDLNFFSAKAPWVTIGQFLVFFLVDIALWLALRERSASGKKDVVLAEEQRERGTSDPGFYGVCAFLIDAPAVLVTVCTMLTLWCLRRGTLISSDYFGADFASGPLFVPTLNRETVHLFLNGVETGAATAVMVVSQVVYVALRIGRVSWLRAK